MIERALILDTETTGVDPEKDALVEVAWILWSVEHRAMVNGATMLIRGESNEAEAINRIPVALLQRGFHAHDVDLPLYMADIVVAHGAEFDRDFIRKTGTRDIDKATWVCTLEDFEWPQVGASRRLVDIALAHDVAVTASHRALHDVLLLAETFRRIPDITERLERARVHALLPKAWIVADVPFNRKDEAKLANFKWFPERKEWLRRMAIEDAKQLPFPTRIDAGW